ncbi:MAG: tRNA (N6-threonylcarbamoyladenosine(37)-N6)-methyltransferase TrmO [Dehalococcoidia bacterium]|jgi:tRNA-Thr(GGU) m(6)t(6)A37 methyltransferase TsaA|nr:tRNA (N6-threonylcarbamoyladenosine(37)-N6)-methyltransferase TrmO [Dehalococcoidia bacterium]MDW8009779.1 tRNA (N6-threonylcarbamoyladenosine(37)-N6)-methyltransferase TrmO [Chloroflexota bacterium]
MLDWLRRLLEPQPEEPGALPEVTLQPVGVVRNRVSRPMAEGWEAVESRIVLRPELAPALLGLDLYSHIYVLFWLHLIPDELRGSRLQLHPRDREDLPLQGLFATRSQLRPNPLGLSVVRLLSVRDNVLRVVGLDAIDGTPVLDLKPYIPYYDAVPNASVPGWVGSLRR